MAYLDLRDLATELEDLVDREEDGDNPLDDDEKERLAALQDLEGQLFTESLGEYAQNDSTMIEDIDFEEYAQELAFDVGYASRDNTNPLHSFIDWEGWADSLKADYLEVTFEGLTYLIRGY